MTDTPNLDDTLAANASLTEEALTVILPLLENLQGMLPRVLDRSISADFYNLEIVMRNARMRGEKWLAERTPAPEEDDVEPTPA